MISPGLRHCLYVSIKLTVKSSWGSFLHFFFFLFHLNSSLNFQTKYYLCPENIFLYICEKLCQWFLSTYLASYGCKKHKFVQLKAKRTAMRLTFYFITRMRNWKTNILVLVKRNYTTLGNSSIGNTTRRCLMVFFSSVYYSWLWILILNFEIVLSKMHTH